MILMYSFIAMRSTIPNGLVHLWLANIFFNFQCSRNKKYLLFKHLLNLLNPETHTYNLQIGIRQIGLSPLSAHGLGANGGFLGSVWTEEDTTSHWIRRRLKLWMLGLVLIQMSHTQPMRISNASL